MIMKLKKWESFNENIRKMISDINGGDLDIDGAFDIYDNMKNDLIEELKKSTGNTTSDLGHVVAKSIYKFFDEEGIFFDEEDFIWGFKHGLENMKN